MIALSSAVIEDGGITRACPRPPALRNATFAERYDWRTLFYDVYRCGRHVVLQGPPFLNLLDHLKADPALRRRLRLPFGGASHIGRNKRGEIWLRTGDERIELDNALGRFTLPVQQDMSGTFARARVIHTLSRNNEVRWIRDWIAFYRELHGANGVLLYDNGSSLYSAADLEAELRAAFPGMAITVVEWPFPYGPQGGMAGAVNGEDAPWDSDFCQTGSLQHARFRFLRQARSVLNVDIDELVLPASGRSIFQAAEESPARFVKFAGHWIEPRSDVPVSPATSRHHHFHYRDPHQAEPCPPKWCVVPGSVPREASWSVHNIFDLKANRHLSAEFAYRHMRAISDSWKEDRWNEGAREGLVRDEALAAAFGRLAAQTA